MLDIQLQLVSELEIIVAFEQLGNYTADNPHKQNSRFCKEIREDNFRYVHVKH